MKEHAYPCRWRIKLLEWWYPLTRTVVLVLVILIAALGGRLALADSPKQNNWPYRMVWDAPLRLRVVDAETGGPLPGALVETPYERRQTDALGRVSLLKGDGMLLHISAPGYQPVVRTVSPALKVVRLSSVRPLTPLMRASGCWLSQARYPSSPLASITTAFRPTLAARSK